MVTIWCVHVQLKIDMDGELVANDASPTTAAVKPHKPQQLGFLPKLCAVHPHCWEAG